MGNPYAPSNFLPLQSLVQSIMVAYQDDALTCQAVADALTGVANVGGVLPVSPVNASWKVGDGLQWRGFQRFEDRSKSD